MTAAATTGPASGPRPASSIPAMILQPSARRLFSWRKVHRIVTAKGLADFLVEGKLRKRASQLPANQSLNRTRLFPHCHRLLALASSQIVELRAACRARGFDFDSGDSGRVQRKNALHTFTVGNAADRECLFQHCATTANYNPG